MNLSSYWQKNRQTISSAILAIVIIVVGFVAYNALSSKPSSTPKNQTINQQQSQKTPSPSKNQENKNVNETAHGGSQGQVNAVKHTVTPGESLSEIAMNYYGNANRWPEIAQENKLANPNIIHRGNILTIPGLSASSSNVATKPTVLPNTASPSPKTYIVKHGDSLWSISQLYFNGDGYQWFKIRDANPTKVGLLPNGRPLIIAGTTLTIPSG